jgi:hypothetical protein
MYPNTHCRFRNCLLRWMIRALVLRIPGLSSYSTAIRKKRLYWDRSTDNDVALNSNASLMSRSTKCRISSTNS